MRKNSIIVLCVLSFVTLSVTPLSAQLYHQLGAVAYGGYSSMVSSSDLVSPGRGYHTTIGFDYELQYGHLLFSTGVAFQWREAGLRVQDGDDFYPVAAGSTIADTQGKQFRMEIFTKERTDFSSQGEMQIPALVGGIYGHFFFLGGFKLNVPVFGLSRTRAHFTTQGLYADYIEPVTSAAFHGFVNNYPANVRGQRLQTIPVDLMASFELGYNFSRTDDVVKSGERSVREMRMRISAYADYSLIPLHQNSSLTPFLIDETWPYDVDRYQPAHILATDAALNTYLANFNVGVKFTILFGNKQRFICLNCESAVEAGINSGAHRKDNRQTNTTHHTTTPASHDGN